jgi:hypothetical protein
MATIRAQVPSTEDGPQFNTTANPGPTTEEVDKIMQPLNPINSSSDW